MIYPVRASRGMPGMLSSRICDDVAVALSGMLYMDRFALRSFPVAPVPRITWRLGIFILSIESGASRACTFKLPIFKFSLPLSGDLVGWLVIDLRMYSRYK